MLNRKIPSVDSNSGWDHIPIKKIDDKLIPVSTISERMIVKPQYFLQSIPDAINEIYLREKVVERLLKSLKKLPDPYAFILYDGWRSFSVQQYLYNKYCKVLSEKYPKLNNIQIQQLASKSVSKPEQSEIKPSPHLTGGSIDLSIVDENGIELDMGTSFDDFSERAKTSFFENHIHCENDEICKNNRRLLYFALTDSGLSNYYNEWWHFDYGNQFWAKNYGYAEAFYGLVVM